MWARESLRILKKYLRPQKIFLAVWTTAFRKAKTEYFHNVRASEDIVHIKKRVASVRNTLCSAVSAQEHNAMFYDFGLGKSKMAAFSRQGKLAISMPRIEICPRQSAMDF